MVFYVDFAGLIKVWLNLLLFLMNWLVAIKIRLLTLPLSLQSP